MRTSLSERTPFPTPAGGTTALTRHLVLDLEVTRDALRCGAPTMVFQPVVGLPQGAPVGVEALARFGPGENPQAWFARAERCGLGAELECAAIANALPILEQLLPDQFLAVNASASTVCSPSFIAVLEGAPLERILLELTEHAAVEDYDELREVLAPLRSAGMRVAVDDLGAGHGDLLHALNLEPDVVKIDRALITGIGQDRRRLLLVAALVSWAEASGMAVVAEGVERPEELEALLQAGVHQVQGFLFGRPTRRLVDGCRRRRSA